MYKVFIENVPLIIENKSSKNVNLLSKFMPELKTNEYEDFVAHLKTIKDSVVLNEKEYDLFFRNFKNIEAAGGVVYHKKIDKYLFIHRLGKWDLPKGKIDEGETPEKAAVREIREECGITGLKLIKPIANTFHTYNKYEDFWLKKTYWFYFEYEKNELLQPQFEEGITTARWFSKEEFHRIYANTYNTIVEVLNEVE